ncbi:MAG: winged helix-turn-helix domain-containing protein [Bacteroidota bacterium]
MYKNLDPLLHSQLRLAIISILASVEEAEFRYIQEKTDATAGNLSVQLNKLKEAEYIDINKQFKGNYPQTTCRITEKGTRKFQEYIAALKEYIEPGNNRA